MAASSLPLLSDNIASLLDDMAAMTEVAARQGAAAADDVATTTQLATKKTAGVLGDDLALHAQQVTGVKAGRELPVVCAVAKGSLRNKAILVPAALGSSAVAPCATGHCSCSAACSCASKVLENSCMFFSQQERGREQRRGELAAHGQQAGRCAGAGTAESEERHPKQLQLLCRNYRYHPRHRCHRQRRAPASVLVGISLLMTAGVSSLVAGSVKPDDTGRSGA